MVNPVSAFANHIEPGHFGLTDETGVIVTEIKDFSLLQIAAWPESLANVAGQLATSIEVNNAPGPGQSIRGESAELLRVEPLKWWCLTKASNQGCDFKLNPEMGNLLELSHSRAWLKIEGDKAPTLLNYFLPIDLRSSSLTNGAVISTAFHHVGVTLCYRDNEFNIFLPRSFALSLWELLYESSLQFGLEVRPA